MSYQRAIAALYLERTDRIPYWHGFPNQADFLKKLTGIDPYQDNVEATRRAIELLDIDVAYRPSEVLPSPIEGANVQDGAEMRYTQFGLGRSRWAQAGRPRWEKAAQRQFLSVREVLDYDPSQDNPEMVEEIAAAMQREVDEARSLLGDRALDDHGWYNTLFMWPITMFGWEMFLVAAAEEPVAFGELLDRFALVTMKQMVAASQVKGLTLFSSHDDLCITRGPVFNPNWYRKYIFPWYVKLWEPLKKKGVKVIWRSDGNTDELIDDVVACGADGFHVRREGSLAQAAKKWGSSKVIIGNIDTKVLTFGTKAEIEDEVKRCVREAGDCPGYFFQPAGDIPHNVPTENIYAFFQACRRYGARS